jgi:hypothetical protein
MNIEMLLKNYKKNKQKFYRIKIMILKTKLKKELMNILKISKILKNKIENLYRKNVMKIKHLKIN